MELAVMIEGQDGLDWGRWRRIVRATEEGGFAGLYRSDHFTNPEGPYKAALELWTSLTWLAENTERIEFGPLVSPVSFRDPRITAWQAGAVNDLAAGKLQLGLGAGWQEREHDAFGFDLLDTDARFARFEEGLKVVTGLLNSDESVSLDGEYYRLEDAAVSPKPERTQIVIGGNGPRRTLPLAARYADEWNAIMQTPEDFAKLSEKLDEMLERAGRAPSEVRRTMMTRAFVGDDEAAVREKSGGKSRDEVLADGMLAGSFEDVRQRLGELQEVGCSRVMLQHLDGEDEIEFLAGGLIG